MIRPYIRCKADDERVAVREDDDSIWMVTTEFGVSLNRRGVIALQKWLERWLAQQR